MSGWHNRLQYVAWFRPYRYRKTGLWHYGTVHVRRKETILRRCNMTSSKNLRAGMNILRVQYMDLKNLERKIEESSVADPYVFGPH